MTADIVRLPLNDPRMVLERTLAKVGRMNSVVIIIEWDDETFAIDHSKMRTSKIALGNTILSGEVMRKAFGDE